jgi:hypothetical protein
LICLCLGAVRQNGLEFIQEDLVFKLNPGLWQVSGDYWFCNNTEEHITQQLYFPIPADSLNAAAEQIKLKLVKPLAGQQGRILSVTPQGFWFEVSLPAKTLANCHLSYRQKLSGKTASYVLLSTQSWGRPLEIASYTLITPKKLSLTKITLDNPAIKEKGCKRYYSWDFTNYLPAHDFSVEFR